MDEEDASYNRYDNDDKSNEIGKAKRKTKENNDIDNINHKSFMKNRLIRYGVLIGGISFVIMILYCSLWQYVQLRYLKQNNKDLYNKLIDIKSSNDDMLNRYRGLNAQNEEMERNNTIRHYRIEELTRKQENIKLNTNDIVKKINRTEQELAILDEENDNLAYNITIKEREIRTIDESIAKYELKIKEIKNKIEEFISHG